MKMLSLLLAALLTATCFVGCASNGVITEIGTEESTTELQTEAPETEPVYEIITDYDPSEGEGTPSDLFAVTYSDSDYEVLCDAIDSFGEIAVKGDDLTKAFEADLRVDYLLQKLAAQVDVANVVYFSTMSDSDKAAYEKNNDFLSDAHARVNDVRKEIYLSDSPYKNIMFANYSEAQLDALVSSDSDKIKAYKDEVNRLTEEFYALDHGEYGWTDTVAEMYVSFVENGNALAREYGYDSYYEYMAAETYKRDYDVDMEEYRRYVIDCIIPLFNAKYEEMFKAAEHTNVGALMAYALLVMDSENIETSGYIEGLIETFDGDVKETAQRLFDGKHIIYGDSDSYPAACTVPLYCFGEAVCYFSTGYYGTASTIAHEMGHFISSYHYGADDGSYDYLEVHSQATEVMLLGYLENNIDKAVYELYESDKIISFLTNIIVSTVVDEFEDMVYHSDKPITVDEIDRIMSELRQKYGAELFDTFTIEEYIMQVIIQSPVYYISYATSATSVLGFYCKLENEGYDAAYESYEKLQTGPIGATFLESLEYADIPSPFEKETFELIEATLTEDTASADAAA